MLDIAQADVSTGAKARRRVAAEQRKGRRAEKPSPARAEPHIVKAAPEQPGTQAADPAQAVYATLAEGPAVFFAAMMFAPYAMATESLGAMRRTRTLSREYADKIARCRNPQDAATVNAQFAERAVRMSANEAWRVFEKSAWLARKTVAPKSIALRDVDHD